MKHVSFFLSIVLADFRLASSQEEPARLGFSSGSIVHIEYLLE